MPRVSVSGSTCDIVSSVFRRSNGVPRAESVLVRERGCGVRSNCFPPRDTQYQSMSVPNYPFTCKILIIRFIYFRKLQPLCDFAYLSDNIALPTGTRIPCVSRLSSGYVCIHFSADIALPTGTRSHVHLGRRKNTVHRYPRRYPGRQIDAYRYLRQHPRYQRARGSHVYRGRHKTAVHKYLGKYPCRRSPFNPSPPRYELPSPPSSISPDTLRWRTWSMCDTDSHVS